MNSISAAAPTVTRPVGRRPVTRLVSRTRDPPPRTSSRADDRFQFRDRRPRYLPVRSRGGVAGRYASASEVGNGTLVPIRTPSKVGRIGAPDGTLVPGASAHHPRRRVAGTRATLSPMPGSRRLGLLVLALAFVLASCGGAAPPSFDPTGACSADGRAAGAYPDLEALVPASYQGAPPETLDSGRNCSTDNLGSLASKGIREVRFAGGTWTFGAERAAVLAVFRTAGLTADALANFYMDSAKVAARTDITGTSEPMIRGPIRVPARHEDRRTRPDRGRVAGRGERRRQRGHHQRPAGCPDPGRDRRVRGPLMLRFVVRYGLVRRRRPACRPGPDALGRGGHGQPGPPDPDRGPDHPARGRGRDARCGGRGGRPLPTGTTGTTGVAAPARPALRGRAAARRAEPLNRPARRPVLESPA